MQFSWIWLEVSHSPSYDLTELEAEQKERDDELESYWQSTYDTFTSYCLKEIVTSCYPTLAHTILIENVEEA
jgi:hypothetical protein